MPVLSDGTVVTAIAPVRPALVVRPPAATRRAVIVTGPQGPPGPGAFDLQEHIDAAEPHPAYDDMVSMTLIFENHLS